MKNTLGGLFVLFAILIGAVLFAAPIALCNCR
jgi:hypothetical protein